MTGLSKPTISLGPYHTMTPSMAGTPATIPGLEPSAIGRLLHAQPCQVCRLLPSMVLGGLLVISVPYFTDN